MSKIAIKGHTTRGSELIELLEMLGGKNGEPTSMGGYINFIYFITSHGFIDFQDITKINIYEYEIFTLEEFFDKYPYKVDDRIRYNTKNGNIGNIISMVWDESINDIIYTVAFSHGYKELTVDKIIPYKEETNIKMNKCAQCVYAVNNNHCGLRGFRSNFNVNYCSAQNVDKLPNGFELQEDGYFSWVNKKPKYPKTYEECHELVVQWKEYDCNPNSELILCDVPIHDFCKLIVARNIYWKIAGEQMGLGKPWEPNYDSGVNKYGIICMNGVVQKSNPTTNWERHLNKVLDFPTEEMRDAFYDNFNDLIECCKELL